MTYAKFRLRIILRLEPCIDFLPCLQYRYYHCYNHEWIRNNCPKLCHYCDHRKYGTFLGCAFSPKFWGSLVLNRAACLVIHPHFLIYFHPIDFLIIFFPEPFPEPMPGRFKPVAAEYPGYILCINDIYYVVVHYNASVN